MITIAQMNSKSFDSYQLSEVRKIFVEDGISVAEWARNHNFSLALVYAVLKGRNQATRGKSHQIAVALGLKQPRNRLASMGLRPLPELDRAECHP